MIKKWVIYAAFAFLAVYLMCFFILKPGKDEQVCRGVEITILDDDAHIITPDYIKSHLAKSGIDPVSCPLDSFLCSDVEKKVKELSIIDGCRCYKTHKDYICIEVSYKRPLMHIINNSGEEFYIDSIGNIITDELDAIYLPLATGYIDKAADVENLKTIANTLAHDEFWMKQIEQIYFKDNKDVVLIPRVGEHVIEVGKAEKIDTKLAKLKEFYLKGLNEIGWNKHSKLNVEFENQVICTKKDK